MHMKYLRCIYMVIAATLLAGCNRAPKPFDYTFSGRTSAHGLVWIDQLSADTTKGIVIYSDLMPTFGDTWNSHDFFKAMREEGVINIQRSVPSLDPPISVKVYEFTNAVSGFHWYHGNFQSQAARVWEAESGEIVLTIQRTTNTSPSMIHSASATLSNIVFSSNSHKQKRTLDRLIIQGVPVESGRM